MRRKAELLLFPLVGFLFNGFDLRTGWKAYREIRKQLEEGESESRRL